MTLLTQQRESITQMANFLESYDVWLCPVSSTTAFAHHKPSSQFGDFNVYNEPLLIDGVPVPYYVATQSYTTLFAVTENPVVTLPLQLDSSGLPIGVQLVGKRFGDFELLQVAGVLDRYHEAVGQPD